ncbi:anthranilate synthase component I [Entomobacter blattae]|uniref:Anthranilate synthase component 1 n=1 Tax=Entomobacter blattae TaxID=2762277 RepID=A0A7H1NSF5_9PROT|nr:anthranilate synthase component I [Entomobacter blattae]QNT78715.1 Anthranilate synthase component 1 [Entomobacter blattae]
MTTHSKQDEQFQVYHGENECGLVWQVGAADLLTPVGAYLRLAKWSAHDGKYMILLESIEGGAVRGRYSVIALMPDVVWKCQDGKVEISQDYSPEAPLFTSDSEHGLPLESLRQLVKDSQMVLPDGLPPMIGGVFGYLGYDMVRQMEVLPHAPPDDLSLPEGVMVRPSLFVIFDNVKDEFILASPVRANKGSFSYEEQVLKAKARVEGAYHVLQQALPVLPASPNKQGQSSITPESTFTREDFLGVVEKIKEYIYAGDAFQVVPSQRFSAPFSGTPLSLYRSLRRVNPAPFMFYLQLEGFALVGSSPEILVRLREGIMTVRPLAGTRPRGKDRAEDLALEKALLADSKEKAEHLMLIDLGRNDVGRVCRLGSVRVKEQFIIERFSHVMHISSTVEGVIKPDHDCIDALVAAFPAGTLTGAPKIRAMEIIDEVERTKRVTYAGCIGYFGVDGSMDTCIGLRMALLKQGRMYVQAGCGVVAESVPQLEYEETQHKARALFRAAEGAWAFAET